MSSTKNQPKPKQTSANQPKATQGSANPSTNEPQELKTFEVPKPKMGEVMQLNKDTYVAVVGGKPNASWTGLETPMDLSEVTAYQHRPMLTNASTKARASRIAGQEKPYESGSKKLKEFVEEVYRHLRDYGMDTIAYVKDPTDESKMTNCVLDYARFSTRTTEKMLEDRFKLYDSYDKKNDKEAVEYLLASVSEKLRAELRSGTSEGEERAFASYFAEFIEIERQATANQLREVTDKIRAVKPSDFVGENLKDMWLYLEPLVQELVSCDAFDHNLTDDLGEMLLTSGGSGPEVKRFHHVINKFLEEHQAGLEEIVFLAPKKQLIYMKEKKLMPSDLFRKVKEEYRKLYNTGKWAPSANIKSLSGATPAVNAAPVDIQPPISILQAAANALVQAMQKGNSKGQKKDKTINCFNCGEEGHVKANCPKLKNNTTGNKKSRRNNPGRQSKDKWKTTAPGPKEAQEKTVNGKKFFWCATCNRWSTTHSTSTHIKRSDTNPGLNANMVPSFNHFAWCVPYPEPRDIPVAQRPLPFIFLLFAILSHFVTLASFRHGLQACLQWVLTNGPLFVPPLLWIGILVVGLAIPSLAPPVRESRRERRFKRIKRKKSRKLGLYSGAVRFGYHRSFPLRCRRKNLHLYMPHVKDRWKPIHYQSLFDRVITFASHFKTPAPNRKGESAPANNISDKRTGVFLPKLPKQVWKNFEQLVDGCLEGCEPTIKPPNKVRFKKIASNNRHSATSATPKSGERVKFSTSATSKNGERVKFSLSATSQNKVPKPSKTQLLPKKDANTKYNRLITENQYLHELRLNKRQWNSVDEVFGTSRYFTFIAQDELPSELLVLAGKIRAAYIASGKVVKPQTKENLLPVIWDSGASVCVSYDSNDFVGPIQSVPAATRLRGFFRHGPRIHGLGYVAWSFKDSTGQLRTLKLPSLYVPEVKQRLLSTSCLLKAYPTETLTIQSDGMTLSGDHRHRGINVPIDPVTNLPTSYAYAQGIPDQPEAHAAPFSTASSLNANLTDSQRELLRWHQKLGHVGYRRVQFLLRSGILGHTEQIRRLHLAAAKLSSEGCPLCAACQFGKQRRRPAPGKRSHIVKDSVGALRRDQLFPGQRVSADHFICSTRGRLVNTRGKESEKEKYGGGCIFVDHASGFVHIEMQVAVSATETIQSKIRFEQHCRDYGVIPLEYQTDNGSAFKSEAFTQHLAHSTQSIRFAGTGAHHQNGIAERAIQSIMSCARTMMLHAAVHWPEAADPQLWPFAVRHSVHLHNFLPNPETGLSPHDLFTRSRHPSKHLLDLHPLFCPVYALDKAIADGHKLPRWKPRSDRYIFVGFSDKHASNVPLLLNPRTGSVVTNFHAVFDDWFATVSSSPEQLPDFGSDQWNRLFGDSEFQYVMEESDAQLQPMEDTDGDIAAKHAARSAEVVAALEHPTPPRRLRLSPTPLLDTPASMPLQRKEPPLTVQQKEVQPQREHSDRADTPPVRFEQEKELTSSSPTPESPPNSKETPTKLAPEIPVSLRRSGRQTRAPVKLEYDSFGDNSPGLLAHFAAYLAGATPDIDIELASAYKASNQDPDLMSYDQAMACEPAERDRWIQAAITEIEQLQKMDCWEEVPISQATGKILPGTWAFRRKRTPDGEIKKWKGRFCVRGDLQEGDFDTFAPLVAWATVRLFLVLSLVLKWKTVSVDFASAFVQAPLRDPIWIHIPRGFRSSLGPNTCLRLKRSLYGLAIAPRLWYQHLFAALLHPEFGLVQSPIDPCLLVSSSLIIVTYCDDVGIAAPSEELIDEFISKLQQKGFALEREGSFEEFLGIKFEHNQSTGTIELTQKGLISKIITEMGLQSCKPNLTPASQLALGRDDDGAPMKESWSYRSIIGMLLYLCTNTRPDISFAVSQAARFSSAPKQSHATAVKTIVRYLAGTKDKGMILKPRGDLKLEMFCDADFGGLYKRDPDHSADSARSRTGYIIKLSGCPLVWKSQLQTEISLSTLEAEYSALSQALRTLLPLKRMLAGIATTVGLPEDVQATVKAEVFEDNQGCVALATSHRLTSRTKYFHVKWHWFWHHYSVHREFEISYVKSALQDADYLTKQTPKDAFQANRLRTQGW